MFWLGVSLVVAAFLFWMWRLDRRRRGATRDLGWSGPRAPIGIQGDGPGGAPADGLQPEAFTRAERRSQRPRKH